MKRLLLVCFLVLSCAACRQQKRIEREVEIQLDQLEKERKMEAYRRSPEYKKKFMKELGDQMPTTKDLENLKVP